ncbi:MAG TPA: SOS response-associated peptidase [Rhodothermales bacterium]|nr:SOS response-associated peptidase [Rhodothermales bacterium]
MCGRFNVQTAPLSVLLLDMLGVEHPGPDNYNLAPTEPAVVVRVRDAETELVPMRWWLTPFWAKELSTRYSMFNAKSETAYKSAAFKEPYQRRRCVVPISGFYEWCRQSQQKLPYFITPSEYPGMLLAGMWDAWFNRDADEELLSFTILTTEANAGLAFIHHRQPVMLGIEDAKRWLDMSVSTRELEHFFASRLPMALDAVPVSSYVNNARNKEARCIEPLGTTVPIAANCPERPQ